MSDKSTTHALRRTSPTGPGQKFVGTCTQCGRTNLTMGDSLEYCDNPRGVSQDQSLLEALEKQP